MKVTFKKSSPEKLKTEFPYVATDGNNFILVTGESRYSQCVSGIMINGNSVYKPFQYSSDGWVKSTLEPFRGKVVIECP